jgi:hypothetical protein
MAHDPMNPFGLPSMGASMSNPGQNPLLASMDMMRQAMTGLSQSAHGANGPLSTPLTPENLERKIGELKVVENWLKLNLSMLSGSIQGLEVQLATVQTLRSFVAMGGTPGASATGGPSPLEVVLGLKPAPDHAAASRPAETVKPPEQTEPQAAPSPEAGSDKAKTTESTSAAAQAWWKMLEGQFAQLAAATTQANAAAQASMAKVAAGQAKTADAKSPAARSTAKRSTATKVATKKTATRRASTKRRATPSE